MDRLISNLDKLLKHKTQDPSRFYTYLADCVLIPQDERYFTESFIPKVYYLYDKNVLRKDLVYLSLLAGENRKVLEKFLDYDKSVFVLNIEDPASLFDYYVYEKRHFIYEIVNNLDSYEKVSSLKNIYGRLRMIQYVIETNRSQVDVDYLEKLSGQIDVESFDDFWKFYVKEIKRFIDVVKFIKPLMTKDFQDTELFVCASTSTLLEMLANYVDLSDPNHWDTILEKLKSHQSSKELNIFTAFVIIATLVRLLIQDNYNSDNQKKDLVNSIFDRVKTWLLELQDKQLQVELLENIFHLMFHRTENEFTCKEKEIRFILFLLKSVIEELQLKKTYGRESAEYEKIKSLNDLVTDFLWRLDLIVNTKMTPKVEEQLLNYMLAPPESLVYVCLKKQNFERAHQVIQIFDLEDSNLAHEVNYAESFLKFKKFLRNNGKLKDGLDKTVGEFFATHPPLVDQKSEEIITELCQNCNDLQHFRADNETFMNIFDFALTETRTWEESRCMLQLAQEKFSLDETISSDYLTFYRKITDLAFEVGPRDNVSLPEILTSPQYPLDVEKYKAKEEFYETLGRLYGEFLAQNESKESGTLNKNHPSHKTLLEMDQLCQDYVQNKDSVRYLQRIFNYLTAFSKIFHIERNTSEVVAQGKNCSYFELLNFNRSELTGRLLFEKHLDPTEFERFFGRLKLDFLYHVAGNCFPTINLHIQENVTIEELYHDNALYIPSAAIISYIQKRNWLLAVIIGEMYKVKLAPKVEISDVRLRTFFNYLKLTRIRNLQPLFEKNLMVAALQNCISTTHVRSYLREQIKEHDMVSLQSHQVPGEVPETAEEVFEDSQVSTWRRLYEVIQSIPENQLRKKTDLDFTKDNILINLVQDECEPEYYRYAYFITDRDRRLDTILNNFKKWPGRFASDLIECEVSRFGGVLDSKLENLRDWIRHIELNDQLKDIFELKSWHKSYKFCKTDPESALGRILLTDEVDLLLDFISVYTPSEEILFNITTIYLSKILDLDIPLPKIKTLLDNLPFEHAIDICHNLLTILKNLEHLQFIVDYLNSNVKDDAFLKNVQVSLKMLTVFAPMEQEQLFCLINEPLSILEVLLMNTKLDKLAQILEILSVQVDGEVISVEKVDRLLRQYAEKSLDFRVITRPVPRAVKTPEVKLLQSLDSLSMASETRPFVVPETVPTKEEWVPNDEVTECMCCRQVTFSMFNRRHHCRRCGRVICYGCSLNRMLVESYGDILVRVCADCYNQTCGSCSSDKHGSSSSDRSSLMQEYWVLNDDPEHNKIMREEFSYEHAPSTSLCLSILKYHSKSVEYPKFLLEQCEVMLKLLQPNQEFTQEIDYLLVIKMLKSLAIAAKIVSTENLLSSGATLAERIIHQAELLALLAERGCLNLMPLVGAHNVYIDANVLRRLRDKLLQREQWNLALEVSTKAGLDNTGVFAAWGKSCLKAGSLHVAREKFQRCFDKHSQYDTSSLGRFSDLNRSLDSLTISRSRMSSRISTGSNLSTGSENRPIKDPPLLHEVIQILETKTRTIRTDVLENAQRLVNLSASMSSLNQIAPFTVHTDTAISVVNRIKNLKEIASGNFSLSEAKGLKSYTTRPTIDPIFYEECIYYLTKYGTHLSLLEFYLRHGDIDTVLLYIIENNLNPEIFVEIYMKCLKDGIVNVLLHEMSRIDSSLNVWKDYLKLLCRHLEKQQLLNCLYQLQLYIGDYVRASMTCIRFYEDNVKNFTDFANNVRFLHKGEEHLRQVLEQEQWVEVASVGKVSSGSKDSFEERMLSNPDLVMKIDTKDVNRHIHTVKRQIEIVKFLSECETSGVDTTELLKQLRSVGDPAPVNDPNKMRLPTLFGSASDQITLAALAIIGARSIDEGFKLATKISEDFRLRPIRVYCLAGKQFARSENYSGISQLVSCIKDTETNDAAISDMLDEMLAQAVATLLKADVTGTKVEELIKLIKDRETRISAYIEARQLKTAYFLAVKYKRTADIRRIQREAELLNMPGIKALCQKVLQSSGSHSKE